jgi:hypothetical protein
MSKISWPAWFYGPNGKSAIFEAEGDVPPGWQDHPEKVAADPSNVRTGSASLAPAAATDKDKAGQSGTKTPTPPATDKAAAATDNADVDAAGWPFDPSLHAATRSKTKDGLWRMKVGVSRPAPKKLDL